MFGDTLRKLREDAGLTQEQLAHRAEVHRTYISLLERDKKSPTLDVVFRLARGLHVRPSQLVAQIEETMPASDRWWS